MGLYPRLGGDEGIARVVDAFYARMLADPEVARWFDGVDMAELMLHQRAFLTVALGGPEAYDGRSMRNAHAGLGIRDADYTRTVGHLRAALEDCDVEQEVIDSAVRRIELMRAAIVEVR